MAASYFGRNYSALSLPIAHGAQAGLRHAQVAAAHALSAHFFSGRAPAIVAMPTGSGKTGVMVLAAFLLRAQRVLVVTPSRMVRDQVAESMGSLAILKKAGAVHRAVELPHTHVVRHLISSDADWRKLEEKDIVVSTIACVSPKPPGVPLPPADLFDLVLLDEAHHAPAPSWHALRTALPGARVVLFTATPFRRDGRTLPGKIVFEYPLARAREDGVFGHVTYEPVLVDPSEDADVAIARAATRRLIADRAAGHPHLLMVRTAERARARELEAIYQRQGVPLKLVLGDISARAMRETVAKLEDGSLHGIICVDMLGEGFDLPALKIAALHSPHRSLAVTLQFIGRFARTSSESNLGQAAFFAVPADIEGDVGPLFREGAEWNEIVEATSRNRIEAEKELRDVFDSFSLNEFDGEAGDEKGLQVSDLSPKFHVKAFLAPTVDLTFPIELPHRGKVILSRKSDKYKSVVIVTKDTQVCRWSRDERVADVKYDLLIVHYHAASGILFLCSTRKEIAVYDAVAGSVSGGNFRLLSPVELNRVLRGISKLQIFSLGMRRRIGREEAYRMTSGRAADKAVRKSDGRHYDRGHCYGKGEDGGAAVTVGFSSASKVWSAMSGSLPRLLDWCGKLAGKISDPSEFTTGCGLDHLPLESRVDKFPAGIFMCDWHHKFYSDPSFSISWDGGKGSVPIVDLELCLISVSVEEVVFSVAGRGVSIEVGYRLDRSPDLFRVSACSVGPVEVVSDDGRVTLEEAMREWPPSFYTASLGRLEGERRISVACM